MRTRTRYPTKPIACWPKMKELRRALYHSNQSAIERDCPIVVGIIEQGMTLLAGLGDYALYMYEPRFTACMRDPEEAARNLEAYDNHGFGRELCSILRLHIGGFLRGHLQEALQGRKPTFVYQWEACPSLMKTTAMLAGERLNVPVVGFELMGPHREGPIDVEYHVELMQEVIAGMEAAAGRPYDDERLIHATRNEWESTVLWAQISNLNKNVPAPLDYRQLQGLRIPNIAHRDRDEVVAFYRELLDEVKERVAEGVSARGYEDARVLMEGLIPLHDMKLLRIPEEYGAINIGSAFCFTGFGSFGVDEQGRWTVATPVWERGNPMRTREDALRALVDLYVGNEAERRPWLTAWSSWSRPAELLWRVRDWKADGVVIGMDRQCPSLSLDQVEQVLVMQQHGIPCTSTTFSFSDPQEYGKVQAYEGISALLESMGLRRADVVPAGSPADRPSS